MNDSHTHWFEFRDWKETLSSSDEPNRLESRQSHIIWRVPPFHVGKPIFMISINISILDGLLFLVIPIYRGGILFMEEYISIRPEKD